MTKKIALITIQDVNNIGNRLQNYALQTVLEERGTKMYDCFTLTNLDDEYNKPLTIKQRAKELVKFWLGVLGLKQYKYKHNFYKGHEDRLKVTKLFSNQYIHNLLTVQHNEVPSDFDLGIVGSDQVWHHWDDDDTELDYYYLTFLPPRKRCAYAASFGFTEFPQEDLEEHKSNLQNMRFISCREQSGCDLVKSVTGRDVPHVLDPTLLLEASDWRDLEDYSNKYSKDVGNGFPYIFVYFLGQITDEYQSVIDKKCQNLGIQKIINFNDLTDKQIASCGPIEFLYFIDHASYVFTDSFHATVFSILFNKSFLVFRRQQEGFMNMFGRIEELLKMTGHEDCAYGGISPNTKAEDFRIIKQRSLDYIDMILNADTTDNTQE